VDEVWSPSTGEYDIDDKLPAYRCRGDAESGRVHPHDGTVTAWRRQLDGSYTETFYTGGGVQPASLTGVAIELAVLFS
jgi:Uma2 family endonuclease